MAELEAESQALCDEMLLTTPLGLALTKEALAIHKADVGHIPLHHQVIPWAMRSNVTVVHRADNWLQATWVKIK